MKITHAAPGGKNEENDRIKIARRNKTGIQKTGRFQKSGKKRQSELGRRSKRSELHGLFANSDQDCHPLPPTKYTNWGEIFGDPVIAIAILDRVLHHASTLNIKRESYPLKEKWKAGLFYPGMGKRRLKPRLFDGGENFHSY